MKAQAFSFQTLPPDCDLYCDTSCQFFHCTLPHRLSTLLVLGDNQCTVWSTGSNRIFIAFSMLSEEKKIKFACWLMPGKLYRMYAIFWELFFFTGKSFFFSWGIISPHRKISSTKQNTECHRISLNLKKCMYAGFLFLCQIYLV